MTYEEEQAKKRQEEEERKAKVKAQKEADTKSALKEVEKGSANSYTNPFQGEGGFWEAMGSQDLPAVLKGKVQKSKLEKEYKDKALVQRPVGASDIADIQKEAKAREENHNSEKEKELQKNKGSIIKNSIIPEDTPQKDYDKAEQGKAVSNVIAQNGKQLAEKNGKSYYQNKDDKHIEENTNSVRDFINNQRIENWEETRNNLIEQGKSFNQIDDKYIKNLPTFLAHSFAKGEFGDPSGADAKLRLAYFVVNGLGNRLKIISNAANVAAGKSPLFTDTQNHWEKIKETNMAKGLQQKWKKNEEEMQTAVDTIKKRGFDEEDINSSISKIQSNNLMASNFNRMTADQKAYMIEVILALGDKFDKIDSKEFMNIIYGAILSSGNYSAKDVAALAGLKVAEESGVTDLITNTSEKVKESLTSK